MIAASRVNRITSQKNDSSTGLQIISISSKENMKLEKKSGFFKLNGDVVIGDLYRDPSNHDIAIVIVSRKVPLESLEPEVNQVNSTT